MKDIPCEVMTIGDIKDWFTLLCVTILFHHLVCVCVLRLSWFYVVTLSYHHSIFSIVQKQKSIPFISSTIVHLTHFVHHSLESYSCYIAIQPYFHDRLRNTIFLKYIHLWAEIKTYGSKPNFANITWCQKWDTNESRR